MPSQCLSENDYSRVFVGYSRDKYEQLCTDVLQSIHTLPESDDIITLFTRRVDDKPHGLQIP